MEQQSPGPLNVKTFRWLGSRDQPLHPDSLRRLLRELGQLPIEIEETEIAVEVLIGRLKRGTSWAKEDYGMLKVPHIQSSRSFAGSWILAPATTLSGSTSQMNQLSI